MPVMKPPNCGSLDVYFGRCLLFHSDEAPPTNKDRTDEAIRVSVTQTLNHYHGWSTYPTSPTNGYTPRNKRVLL